jgi:hypothetical protein
LFRALDLLLGLLASKLVRGYQLFISPALPPSCRYYPTCSEYSRISFERHGFVRGFYLTTWRILRCNPWNPGGYDPVPSLRNQPDDTLDFYKEQDTLRNASKRTS